MRFFMSIQNETIHGISNTDDNETKYSKVSCSSVRNPMRNGIPRNETNFLNLFSMAPSDPRPPLNVALVRLNG